MVACNSKKRELQNTVKVWQGRKLEFPILQAKYAGYDTLWEEWKYKKYKLVNYVDTTGCTSCQLNLYGWSEFIDAAEKTMPDLVVVFILALPDMEEFEKLAQVNHFELPVLHDPMAGLDSLNNLPENPLLRTFLLDSLNQVIILGNPVRNPAIKELLLKTVK